MRVVASLPPLVARHRVEWMGYWSQTDPGFRAEIGMKNLFQLVVLDAERPAPDSRHKSDGWVFERITEGVATDQSRRAHDDKTRVARRRSVHDSARSSSQST